MNYLINGAYRVLPRAFLVVCAIIIVLVVAIRSVRNHNLSNSSANLVVQDQNSR